MQSFWKLHKISILLVLGSLLFYAVFAYDLNREDFPKLLALFFALFFLGFKLIQFEKWNYKFLLIAGLLFRLVFLIATPNLSQDFYRFIWDGELVNQGINPYLYTPNEVMENPAIEISNTHELYKGMGSLSARHFSNYPPVNQFLFAVSSFLGMGSVIGSIIWMRLCIVAADLGIFYFGKKLLENLNVGSHHIFWYFLNPLVIIELTGNLHFEGVMLFFFIWALYFIAQGKYLIAAPIYAASIMLKLVPLLFLPLFLRHMGWKKSVTFYISTTVASVIFLTPFFHPDLAANYSKTIALWFSNFEFNAGLYNVIKLIAVNHFDAKPWELIKAYGTFVKIATIVLILGLTFFRKHQNLKSVISSMFFVLCFYYLISTTLHPWYVIFLVLLGLFTNYRFPLLWSCLIVLSYYTYGQPEFKENLWVLSIEYLLLFAYLIYEIVKNHNNRMLIRKKS